MFEDLGTMRQTVLVLRFYRKAEPPANLKGMTRFVIQFLLGEIMKKKFSAAHLFSVCVVTLGLIAGTAGAGTAASIAAAPTKQQAPSLTKEAYVSYLEENLATSSYAQENLALFETFSNEKQDEVIANFNDPGFQKALLGTPADQKAHGITSLTKSESSTSPSAKKSDTMNLLSVYDVNAKYTHSIYSYGLHMISVNQDFYYQTGSGRVLATKNCFTSYSKSFPAGSVSQSTSHFLWGDQGKCRTTWTLDISWGIGNVAGTSIQELTVNGPGVVSRVFYDV